MAFIIAKGVDGFPEIETRLLKTDLRKAVASDFRFSLLGDLLMGEVTLKNPASKVTFSSVEFSAAFSSARKKNQF